MPKADKKKKFTPADRADSPTNPNPISTEPLSQNSKKGRKRQKAYIDDEDVDPEDESTIDSSHNAWVTLAQSIFFEERYPLYLECSAKGTRDHFWTSVSKEFLESWPVGLSDQEKVDLPIEEHEDRITELTEEKKVQIKRWYGNRRGQGRRKERQREKRKNKNPKTSKDNSNLLRDLAMQNNKTRVPQAGEAYSTLFYNDFKHLVEDAISSEEQLKGGRLTSGRKLVIRRRIAREELEKAPPQKKKMVEEFLQGKKKQNEQVVEAEWKQKLPSEIQTSIDDLLPAAKEMLRCFSDMTGKTFLLLCGGPSPEKNGEIKTYSVSAGPTLDNATFPAAYPAYETNVLHPWIQYVMDVYPPEKRELFSMKNEERFIQERIAAKAEAATSSSSVAVSSGAETSMIAVSAVSPASFAVPSTATAGTSGAEMSMTTVSAAVSPASSAASSDAMAGTSGMETESVPGVASTAMSTASLSSVVPSSVPPFSACALFGSIVTSDTSVGTLTADRDTPVASSNLDFSIFEQDPLIQEALSYAAATDMENMDFSMLDTLDGIEAFMSQLSTGHSNSSDILDASIDWFQSTSEAFTQSSIPEPGPSASIPESRSPIKSAALGSGVAVANDTLTSPAMTSAPTSATSTTSESASISPESFRPAPSTSQKESDAQGLTLELEKYVGLAGLDPRISFPVPLHGVFPTALSSASLQLATHDTPSSPSGSGDKAADSAVGLQPMTEATQEQAPSTPGSGNEDINDGTRDNQPQEDSQVAIAVPVPEVVAGVSQTKKRRRRDSVDTSDIIEGKRVRQTVVTKGEVMTLGQKGKLPMVQAGKKR
ncbi:hypothetical protein VKT23_020394 [Stygiomarasmius scandens]|uniref:Uncharacterized protein n=1 Tax=Marasmiellus scandens TaxID=2682957 RepID=A0ABR1IJ61_9AGAR